MEVKLGIVGEIMVTPPIQRVKGSGDLKGNYYLAPFLLHFL